MTCWQVRNSVEVAVADRPAAAGGDAFDFAAYMKERAMLMNDALDKSVPLQYPEAVTESMRCACERPSLLCMRHAEDPSKASERASKVLILH